MALGGDVAKMRLLTLQLRHVALPGGAYVVGAHGVHAVEGGLPAFPGGHAHVCGGPLLLVQTAVLPQPPLFVAHSLMSTSQLRPAHPVVHVHV